MLGHMLKVSNRKTISMRWTNLEVSSSFDLIKHKCKVVSANESMSVNRNDHNRSSFDMLVVRVRYHLREEAAPVQSNQDVQHPTTVLLHQSDLQHHADQRVKDRLRTCNEQTTCSQVNKKSVETKFKSHESEMINDQR